MATTRNIGSVVTSSQQVITSLSDHCTSIRNCVGGIKVTVIRANAEPLA